MGFQPTPKQALMLWNLLITGERPMRSKLNLTVSERTPLVQAGFITLGGTGQSIELNDKVWDWATENFHVELSRSKTAAPILQALLAKLGAHLQSQNIPLASFLISEKDEDNEKQPASHNDLQDSIRQAYLGITGGQYNTRVRLAQLRQILSHVARDDLDRALEAMEVAGQLVLMRLDDPQEITPEDARAALGKGTFKRHIVYLRG